MLDSKSLLHDSKKDNKEYVVAMKQIARISELLISQTKAEKAVLSEIFLRIMATIAYHNSGNDEPAEVHLQTAIQLAILDQLFRPFVEYQIDLDYLLEQEFRKMNHKLCLQVKNQYKRLTEGWIPLHNAKLNKTMSVEFTIREREVSCLAASGLSNAQIAERLQISLNTVKHTIQHAMEKIGCEKRTDLIHFI